MAAIPSDDMTRATINRDYLIRYTFHGEKNTHLIGAGQYHTLVTQKTAKKHFERVLEGDKDKYTFKVRNTLKIEFLIK